MSDADIDADRQATVASSGGSDNLDSESPNALFGDAAGENSSDSIPSEMDNVQNQGHDYFGEDMEKTPDYFGDGNQEEKKEDDWGFGDSSGSGNDFDDSVEDQIDFGEGAQDAAESGSGIVTDIMKGLWDLFSDDD